MSDEIREALIRGDVGLLFSMWGKWFPLQHQPATMQEAEVMFHAARTAAGTVPLRLRCYSHHWLTERKLDSFLPAELLPQADIFKPRIEHAVGFSFNSLSKTIREAKPEVEAAVSVTIEEMAADNLLVTDPDRVRAEMMYTKNRTLKQLFGNTRSLKRSR